MTTFAGYRPFFVQVVTGYTEFMRRGLTPAFNLPFFLVVALPALVIGQLLVLVMRELKSFFAHFHLDDLRALVFGICGKEECRRQKKEPCKEKRTAKESKHDISS